MIFKVFKTVDIDTRTWNRVHKVQDQIHETTHKEYERRGQSSKKSKVDGYLGKLMEFGAYKFLQEELEDIIDKKDYKPDCKVYKGKNKKFDHDLVNKKDLPNITVKSVKHPYPYRWAKSWVIQKKNPRDYSMLDDYKHHWFIFGSVNYDERKVNIEYFGPISELHKNDLISEMEIPRHRTFKCAVYSDTMEKVSKKYNKKEIIKCFLDTLAENKE